MNLSLAWTTDAVVAGFKDTTRRDWADRTLGTYQRIYELGAPVALYDKSTRQHGRHIGDAVLTAMPFRSTDLPAEDYDREGFTWLGHHGYRLSVLGHDDVSPATLWRAFALRPEPLVIVRFRVISLSSIGWAIRWRLKAEGKLLNPIEGVTP